MPSILSQILTSKEKLKLIRPYVNFHYDLRKKLTPAQKAQITRYYNEIEKLKNRPNVVFRPKSKKHLIEAKKFAGGEKFPKLKVAFIPTFDPDVKVKFTKKGRIKLKQKYVTTSRVELDPDELVANHVRYLDDVLPNVKSYTIGAGNFEIPSAYGSKKECIIGIIELMLRYRNDDDIEEKDQEDDEDLEYLENHEDDILEYLTKEFGNNRELIKEFYKNELERANSNNKYNGNNDWRNWLNHVNIHEFHNQATVQDFILARAKAKEKKKKERDKAKDAAIKRKKRNFKPKGKPNKRAQDAERKRRQRARQKQNGVDI